MAVAICNVLDHPLDPAQLKARAADFGVDVSVQRYLVVLLEGGVPLQQPA
jgi:hypothetical protein